MKKNFTLLVYVLPMLFVLGSTRLSAAVNGVGIWPDYPGTEGVNNGLVLNKSSEYTLNTIDSEEFNLNGPGAQITFSAKRQTAGVNPLRVGQYVDGAWKEITKYDISTSYADYGPINIDKRATKIKIYTTTGATLKKYFQNLKVTQAVFVGEPSQTEIAVGTAKLNADNSTATFTMDWCNVAAFSAQISGANASLFDAQITAGNALAGKWGQMTVKVIYKHTTSGEHSATLTLSNGTQSKTVNLTGVTQKKDQVLSWSADWSATQPSIPVGKEVSNAVTSTGGLTVTYESSNDTVIAITQDGTAFKAIAAGEAVITAKQVGNDDWNEATPISKTFVSTEKIIQSIQWSQNFTRLKTTDEAIVLNAKVMLLNPENGEWVYSEGRTIFLTYEVEDSTIVSVADSVLTIVGEGSTTLTAKIEGDEYYEGAALSVPVTVRVPSVGCEDQLVGNDLTEAYEFWHFSATTSMEKIVTIDRTTGVPDKMTFQHRRLKWGGFSGGDIEVYESTDGGKTWGNKLYSVEPQLDNYTTSTAIQLSRNATHIKFFRPSNATGYHYVKDVQITPAQYLEAQPQKMEVSKSVLGDILQKEVVINFSNVKEEILVSHKNVQEVVVTETTLGNECGDFGSYTLHLTITPAKVGEIIDTLVMSDAISGMTLMVPVYVTTQLDKQVITWTDCPDSIAVGDTVIMHAVAKTAIRYESSDSTIAYAVDSMIYVLRAGEVEITAVAEQSDRYEQTSMMKSIVCYEVSEPTALTALKGENVCAIKRIENGRMVIIRDGVRYSALGTVLQ